MPVQIAGLDLYVNHPVIALGSSEWIPASLELGGRAAAACETHLVVRVQPQTSLVRVRIFHADPESVAGPGLGFTTVFSGPLLLPDGRLVVGDIMGQSRFTTSLLGPGLHRARVDVDDAVGHAHVVDITVARDS
ncbi:hypothetical protein ACIQOV_02815 [Kitasatospora sp. NPDC091257]|uniref:hypothetical protein n=1 Tax=Kitasatospora sp. NPDC091257 TaxID=3364084 RepID=UPI00380AA868